MKKNQPYIGITGFMSQEETEQILSAFPRNSIHKLMIGVLASTATVWGRAPSRFFGRYPAVGTIAQILPDDPRAFNVIHFNDKTKDNNETLHQMTFLTDIGGANLHGLQLNIAWPHPDILNAYRCNRPGKKIILQIGKNAFAAVAECTLALARKIRDEYSGLIDYVLFDPSGGEGKKFEVDTALLALWEIHELCGHALGLGIAGGLDHNNTDALLKPLVKYFPALSADAESKLRDLDDGDKLNIQKATLYIQACHKLFTKK